MLLEPDPERGPSVNPLEKDLQTGEKWKFDADVASEFGEMLRRSIPDFERMRELSTAIGDDFARPGSAIVDLGASRGDAIAPYAEREIESYPAVDRGTRFVAIETAPPMLDALRERFPYGVEIEDWDLRNGLPFARFPWVGHASLVLGVLTLQFVPIDHRIRLIEDVFASLSSGGAFLVVEKTLPASGPEIDRVFRDRYWDVKRSEGYTDEEILRKQLALEGVLVPLPADWTVDALRRAGFVVEGFWRWLQFAGWIGVKP